MNLLFLLILPIFTLLIAFLASKYVINPNSISSSGKNTNGSKKDKTSKKTQDKDFSIKILYASQTGTSEKYSKKLRTALNNSYGEHIQVPNSIQINFINITIKNRYQ